MSADYLSNPVRKQNPLAEVAADEPGTLEIKRALRETRQRKARVETAESELWPKQVRP